MAPLRLEHPDPDGALTAVRLQSDLPLDDEARAFTRQEDGTWVLELPDVRLHRLEYLLELDGDTQPDPAADATAPGAFGEKSVWCAPDYEPPWWTDEVRDPLPSTSTELRVRSRALRGSVHLRTWAPEELAPDHAAPLLVVHDGDEFESLAGITHWASVLIGDSELPPFRMALLSAYRRDERYSASTAYARALCDEVLPALGEQVAIASRPVVMGASLGGLASLHAAHRHPGVFGGVFPQSGSFFHPEHDGHERGFGRWTRITRWVRALLAERPHLAAQVVMTCGAEEENIHNNRLVAEALGAPLHELGDLHNYTAWRDALDPHLTQLLLEVWG